MNEWTSDDGRAVMHCGDCLDVMPQLEAGSIDLVLTDPPYGTTACKWDAVIPFEPMWAGITHCAKKNAAIVLTASQPFTSALVMSNTKMFRYCWVWEKSRATGFPNANRQPLRNYEDATVFYARQSTYNPQGVKQSGKRIDRKSPQKETVNNGENDGSLCKRYTQVLSNYPKQIVRVPSEGGGVHPTQKPVALMEYLIRTYTNKGDTVLDFTMGSGTTLVAAIRTGRKAIGIELDAGYVEIAKQRVAMELERDSLFNTQ